MLLHSKLFQPTARMECWALGVGVHNTQRVRITSKQQRSCGCSVTQPSALQLPLTLLLVGRSIFITNRFLYCV